MKHEKQLLGMNFSHKNASSMKWWQKKVKGWAVPFWYTDTPLVSKRAVEYGLGKLAKQIRKQKATHDHLYPTDLIGGNRILTSSNNNRVPILRGCPNQQCFCTGKCQDIIGYRYRSPGESPH